MNSLEKILKWSFLSLLLIWGITYPNQNTKALLSPNSFGPPAGGQVIEMSPICPLPVPHITFSTAIYSPGAGSGMWNWVYGGTFPYNYGPINHIGQSTIGMGTYQYMPCLQPCFAGVCPAWPHGGLNLLYTGTSV